MLILSFGCLRFLRESCLLYAFLLGYLPSIFFGLFLQNLLTFICRTAYVVLAVKRKRQSYIKKKQRDNEKENRTKKEAEQSEFRTSGYDMWSRMEPLNEKLVAAMQQLSLKERFNPILNILIVTRGIIHVYTSAMRMLCRCDASAAKKLSGQCIRRNLDSLVCRHYNAKESKEKES